MNPLLSQLHPYPFEKLATLKQGINPAQDKPHIALSLGEPQHQIPDLIGEVIVSQLHGLMKYPTTLGIAPLRQAIARWLEGRFELDPATIDGDRHILPVSGTREALFSFAQCVVDPGRAPIVVMLNPFYQIYEGAALLAGAQPHYVNTTVETGFVPDFLSVPDAIWSRCQLLYICPCNENGFPGHGFRRSRR